MKLRPNQAYALTEIPRRISQGHRRICVVSPTGGGKSLIMFRQIQDTQAATSLYTDRRMLFDQIYAGLAANGISCGRRAAGYRPKLFENVQLCMVQTEAARAIKGGADVHASDQVIIDEAHKNAGGVMLKLLAKHVEARPGCVTIGFTATPLAICHAYDTLVIAGTNSELRSYGALVPAYHFGPDEPDTKWVGKIAVGEGECGITRDKRMQFATRVFGRMVEHDRIYNPEQRPTLLFAPGVAESKWCAQELCRHGIAAAHIDGETIWVDGEEFPADQKGLRDELADRSKSGDIKVVCNRFVLREGIDWPWVSHGIFLTVFGSLTSYLQSGGRLLRAYPGKECCTIQDHGGNWWRHDSLNADREWELDYTDVIAAGVRAERLRNKSEPEPITCPKCHAVRLSGSACFKCGFKYDKKVRIVVQSDGTLREMKGDIFRARRVAKPSESLEKEWASRVRAARVSKKETVKRMTFAQLEAAFARDHHWQYPPRTFEAMPTRESDWFRPVRDVPESALQRSRRSRSSA